MGGEAGGRVWPILGEGEGAGVAEIARVWEYGGEWVGGCFEQYRSRLTSCGMQDIQRF